MRDYSKVSGQFWTGKTGKALRGDIQAQVIALYLLTSPHANMIGVFNCPILYIAHETGCPIEGATKGLLTLCEGGFCTYDHDTDTVWVHEMARFQVEDQLKETDKRVSGIQKQFDLLPEGRIKTGFFERYRYAFFLTNSPPKGKPHPSPLEAPTKPEAGTGTETVAGAEPLSGENLPAQKKVRKQRAQQTSMPENFVPSAGNVAIAEKHKLNISVEADKFLGYHGSKGNMFADWHMAFSTWLNKAAEYRVGSNPQPVGTRTVGGINIAGANAL